MTRLTMNEVEVFARNVPHPEGVAFGVDGWLYSGGAEPDYQGKGPIYRITPDGNTTEVFVDTGGRVLGIAFDREGCLFACDSECGVVWRVDLRGGMHVFADRVGDRQLLAPNFLVFDAAGQLYVSDSGTARAGERTGAVYRFQPDGRGEVFVDGLVFANGLALDADEDALYVVETRDDRVLQVPIRSNGTAGEPQVYASGLKSGPDGLAFDVTDNLYVTLTRTNRIVAVGVDGVVTTIVSDPKGECIRAPSNLAFGGSERREIYVANLFGRHVSRFSSDAPGLPLYHQA